MPPSTTIVTKDGLNMNTNVAATRGQKISQKTIILRDELWPSLSDEDLWIRKKRKGFTTIPRSMPIIMRIMDNLSVGKPVSSCYFPLWCRVFDECLVTINNVNELAFESGFSGQRAEATWMSRMKILKELGFIDIKPGASSAYKYVLIFNPYNVIKKHKRKKKVNEGDYNALFARAQEIGAKDLENK